MADIADTASGGKRPAGISGVAGNAVCEGDHTMNVTYTLASGYSNGNFTFTLDGKKVTPIKVKDADNKYRVQVVNIGAPEIAKAHVFTVSDGKDTYAVTASLMSLFKAKVAKSGTAQASKDMSKAIFLYYKAACEYDGSAKKPGKIESVFIRFGEQEAGENVVVLPDEAVTASWGATGDLSGFSYEVLGPNGAPIAKGTGNSYAIAADATVPGEIYTLKAGVKPINGSEADIVWTTVRFKRGAAVESEFVTEDTVLVGYNGNGGDVVIPDKGVDGKPIVTIAPNVFKDNTKLTSVTIGANVTEIKDSAFEGCTALQSVTIPNGVTTIGQAAFKNCTSLNSMETYD